MDLFVDENRIQQIFDELSEQLESATEGEVKRSDYQTLEDRANFHESEERRARNHLPIILNQLKQSEIYRQINLKKNRSKEKTEAYRKEKQGF